MEFPMQPSLGGNASDQYLLQKINGASTEQLVVLLLDGAQRFLAQAIQAMSRKDIPAKARLVNRVSAIVEELSVWVDQEQGGELAINLTRIYEWWLNELFEGSQSNQVDRLTRVQRQMGELRATWEQLDQKQRQTGNPASTTGFDGVVG
jgi:flagellar protein FliS